MTNEEFKNKNNEFIMAMMQIEDKIKADVNGIVGDFKLPNIMYTIAEKINEILNTMEKSHEALNQQVTVVIETQYLLNICNAYMKNLDSFVKRFVAAVENNDQKTINELAKSKDNFREFWNKIDDEIRQMNLQDILNKIIETKMPLPQNIKPELAIKICNEEFRNANYIPEKKIEEAHFNQVM